MRLRNKKTGKIWHMPRLRQPTVQEDDISFFACISEHGCSRGELFSYKTLDELNEDWEDYEPAEPLIKDEKIRNLIKNFALSTNATWIQYESTGLRGEFWTAGGFIGNKTWKELEGLVNHRCYTITELCGEEKE